MDTNDGEDVRTRLDDGTPGVPMPSSGRRHPPSLRSRRKAGRRGAPGAGPGCEPKRLLVYEPHPKRRRALSQQLGDLGHIVAPFGDAGVAFLFLLGHLPQLDAALVNTDDPDPGRWLIDRVQLVPGPPAVLTYSAKDLAGGAPRIAEWLLAGRSEV